MLTKPAQSTMHQKNYGILWLQGAFGFKAFFTTDSVGQSPMADELRSNLWSAETLTRGIQSVQLQTEDLLRFESMSDEALLAQLQDD